VDPRADPSAYRNVISANGGHGILVSGSNATDNRIASTHVGVNFPGIGALGNGRNGITFTNGAVGNLVGPVTTALGVTVPESRNVISANGGAGVQLLSGADTNRICGNLIGTDATGSIARGNDGDGILIEGATDGNRVGGVGVNSSYVIVPDGANVIAHNGRVGVLVSSGGGIDGRAYGLGE
jgi:hypothetical protein